jgi:hypothetical protein
MEDPSQRSDQKNQKKTEKKDEHLNSPSKRREESSQRSDQEIFEVIGPPYFKPNVCFDYFNYFAHFFLKRLFKCRFPSYHFYVFFLNIFITD